MRRFVFAACLTALVGVSVPVGAAVPDYDAEAALAGAKTDVANWMSYLPDDVYVAHVSIPGTHDAATGHEWESSL